MEKRRGDDDVLQALAGLGMILGLLGYRWWQMGDAGRRTWLDAVRRAEGYGPVPAGLPAQIEWLATNRLAAASGMAALLLLAAAAGLVEGNARRRATVLSGFGLRPLRTGRALGLAWIGCLVLWLAVPLPLPYVGAAGVLACLLGAAAYKLGRGVRRVH